MKKRGFTLVELLAVIAILAILVIMALPAVLRMFTQARIDSFTNELNTILRTARQQYLLSGGQDTAWSNAEGSSKSLDLTGNSNLKYYVQMNNEGKIIKLQVTNGDFQYNVTNNNGIDIVESSNVQEVTDENRLIIDANIKYLYYVGYTTINIGDTLLVNNTNTFDNYNDAVSKFGNPFFIVNLVNSNNIIMESSIGFIKDGNVYNLKLANNSTEYESNKATLANLFGNDNCVDYTSAYSCSVPNLMVDNAQSSVGAQGNGLGCRVHDDGMSGCGVNE